MTPHERHVVWKRARTRTDEHAREVTKLIEDSGLPYSDDASLRMDDPVTIRNSAEGRAAMIAATEKGLPAISGVDHRLSAELGVNYGGIIRLLKQPAFLSPNAAAARLSQFWQKGKVAGAKYRQDGRDFREKTCSLNKFAAESARSQHRHAECGVRSFVYLAPRVGFEPTTNRLTAGCSTAELPGSRGEGECPLPPITKPPLHCKVGIPHGQSER